MRRPPKPNYKALEFRFFGPKAGGGKVGAGHESPVAGVTPPRMGDLGVSCGLGLLPPVPQYFHFPPELLCGYFATTEGGSQLRQFSHIFAIVHKSPLSALRPFLFLLFVFCPGLLLGRAA